MNIFKILQSRFLFLILLFLGLLYIAGAVVGASTLATEPSSEPTTLILIADQTYRYTLDFEGIILKIEITNETETSVLEGEELPVLNIDSVLANIISRQAEDTLMSIQIIGNNSDLNTALSTRLLGLYDIQVEVLSSIQVPDEETTDDEITDGNEDEKNCNPNDERFELAESLGITPGKMNLLQKLDELSDEPLDYQLWASKSVQEIMKEIKALKASMKNEHTYNHAQEDETWSKPEADKEDHKPNQPNNHGKKDKSKKK